VQVLFGDKSRSTGLLTKNELRGRCRGKIVLKKPDIKLGLKREQIKNCIFRGLATTFVQFVGYYFSISDAQSQTERFKFSCIVQLIGFKIMPSRALLSFAFFKRNPFRIICFFATANINR
tara:strand:- start:242 stop:601 length:360 start_codon:yes stop_codon:yes gene_type:complete